LYSAVKVPCSESVETVPPPLTLLAQSSPPAEPLPTSPIHEFDPVSSPGRTELLMRMALTYPYVFLRLIRLLSPFAVVKLPVSHSLYT
jgi:hypothetical protein